MSFEHSKESDEIFELNCYDLFTRKNLTHKHMIHNLIECSGYVSHTPKSPFYNISDDVMKRFKRLYDHLIESGHASIIKTRPEENKLNEYYTFQFSESYSKIMDEQLKFMDL